MTKQEFLKDLRSIDTKWFTCIQIKSLFGQKVRDLYDGLFNPFNNGSSFIVNDFFLDSDYNYSISWRKEQEIRKAMLKEFKSVAIKMKLWEEL